MKKSIKNDKKLPPYVWVFLYCVIAEYPNINKTQIFAADD